MIFVTVGTHRFDALIKAVDELAGSGLLPDPVVYQIGSGEHLPSHGEYFRFERGLQDRIDSASLVICHGGTGTVFSLLNSGKPFVAVANRALAHDHQSQFLARIAGIADILWTKDLSELPELIEKARTHHPRLGAVERLGNDLKNYLSTLGAGV